MNSETTYPKFRFFIGIAAAVAWFNIGWVIVGFAPLLPFIAADLNISVGTAMIGVMALNSVAGATSIILCGPLIDKYGPRKVLFISSILLVVYALLIPYFSHNLTQIVLLRILAGIVGHGPLFAGMAAMARRWFPHKEQATWIGIWNAAFPVGVAVMYLVYFPLLKMFDGSWRAVGAFSAVPSAILAIMMFITLFGKEPELVRHTGAAGKVEKDFSIALKLPVLWAGALLLGCAQGIMQTVNGLTASYLMTNKQGGLNWLPFKAGPAMTFIQWGMVVSGFLMATMLVYIFRGSIKWLASSTFLLAGLAALAMTSGFAKTSLSHMEIVFVVVGYLMNVGYPATTTFVTHNYPPHILGKVFGVSGGISIYFGAFFSGLAGYILDKANSYSAVYIFVFAIAVLACIVSAIFLSPIKIFQRGDGGQPQGGPPAAAH